MKCITKCDSCGWKLQRWMPKRICPDCGDVMMFKYDWAIWVLMNIMAPFVHGIDYVIRFAYLIVGRKVKLINVSMSTRGDLICNDCKQRWTTNHECWCLKQGHKKELRMMKIKSGVEFRRIKDLAMSASDRAGHLNGTLQPTIDHVDVVALASELKEIVTALHSLSEAAEYVEDNYD